MLQIHAWPVHTPRPEGGHVGYTVLCAIDNLVRLVAIYCQRCRKLQCCGSHVGRGIPFLAAGDLPKNAFSSSEQKRYKSPRAKWAIFKNDMVLEQIGCEEVGCIMTGSWYSSVQDLSM